MPTVDLSQRISPRDLMLHSPGARDHYFHVGRVGLEQVRLALELSGAEAPRRLLDLPCGHGRVLRWLRAEYPEAVITACDLDRDAVDFCVTEFGVEPLYSREDPEDIPLASYDLAWVGSLFTHLDAPLWPRFLTKLAAHARVVVFTVGGRFFGDEAWIARQGVDVSTLMDAYDSAGFGYAEYQQPGYGLTRAKPSWVLSLLDDLNLKVIHFAEGAWAPTQDVYVVTAP